MIQGLVGSNATRRALPCRPEFQGGATHNQSKWYQCARKRPARQITTTQNPPLHKYCPTLSRATPVALRVQLGRCTALQLQNRYQDWYHDISTGTIKTMGRRTRSSHAAPLPPSRRSAPPPPDTVPLLVTVLAGNVVTAAMVAACLNTEDATALRRLHPAIAAAVATVPWADTTTTVRDIERWRAALPAAVSCKLSRGLYQYCEAFGDADIARLPSTLRSLDVSFCKRLTRDVSFAHLPVLELLDCSGTSVGMAGVACLPRSLRELRMKYCELHTAADFSRLRALRVLDCGGIHGTLGAAAVASLPPSLEVLNIGRGAYNPGDWPRGGSLAHLTRLRVLCVDCTRIDAAVLATFPPSLHCLDIKYCSHRGGLAASFAHLHCLHTLDASASNIGDVATLPPTLVSLDLSDCESASLAPPAVFPHLPALRVLNVSTTALGDAAVASMPPGLEELRMVDCANVTRSASLGHLTALRVLHSSGTDLAPDSIASCRARGCAAPADGVVTIPNVGRVLLVPLPDGRLFTCTRSGWVVLWAAAHGGAPLAETQLNYPLAELCVCALAVLPDGHHVAIAVKSCGRAPSSIVVWDTRDVLQEARGAINLSVPVGDSSQPSALAALPDGHLAVGFYTDGALRIVDVDAGAMLATFVGHSDSVAVLVALPDGRLASGSLDKTVRLWDVEARVCVATLAGHTGTAYSLAVLPDGRLASGSSDCTVRLWDVGQRVCVGVWRVPATRGASALAALPGSNRLASVSCDNNTLRVWDCDAREAAGGVPRLTVELDGARAEALVVLPDGRLATGGGRGVRLWRVPLDYR